MSVDFNVYVGPYLDIREPVTRSTVDYCAGHGRETGASYCPECARSKDRRYSERVNGPLDEGFWDHNDWVDRLLNVMSNGYETAPGSDDARTMRAISNRRGFGLQLDRDDDAAAHDIPTAEGFAEALAPEIERIRELGCTVEVKLGVLVWYS